MFLLLFSLRETVLMAGLLATLNFFSYCKSSLRIFCRKDDKTKTAKKNFCHDVDTGAIVMASKKTQFITASSGFMYTTDCMTSHLVRYDLIAAKYTNQKYIFFVGVILTGVHLTTMTLFSCRQV